MTRLLHAPPPPTVPSALGLGRAHSQGLWLSTAGAIPRGCHTGAPSLRRDWLELQFGGTESPVRRPL